MAVTRPLLVTVLLVATFGASAGQVYKWIDPSGKVRYSDMPQTGWKRVDPATGAAIEPSALSADDAAEQEEEAAEAEGGNDSDAGQQAAADKEPSPVLKAKECKRRREQLENYQRANRVVEEGANGVSKEYTETERLKLIERTQQQVKELCG